MTRTFLIHKLAQIYLAAETTGITTKAQFMPTVQFLSWKEAEEFFAQIGASPESVGVAKRNLDTTGNTQLIIPN
jgi:hypothetical protein